MSRIEREEKDEIVGRMRKLGGDKYKEIKEKMSTEDSGAVCVSSPYATVSTVTRRIHSVCVYVSYLIISRTETVALYWLESHGVECHPGGAHPALNVDILQVQIYRCDLRCFLFR
jgi:hypothetical protein